MVAAQTVEPLSAGLGLPIICADREQDIAVDITSKESVERFFGENSDKFQHLVLFAGFTNVDEAEKQRGDKDGTCWQVNVKGVENIVDACRKFQKKLIFISTDFVFDGTSGPYSEDDVPGPDLNRVGWYGITKIEGEKYIRENLDAGDILILRISYPYSGHDVGKEDFLIKILNLYKTGKLYPMYADQTFTPTYIPDVAPAILALLAKGGNGVYHLASPQTTTPYEFAKYLLEKYEGREVIVQKGSLQNQLKEQKAVPRPLLGGLKTKKIETIFTPSSWHEGIDKALSIWLK